MTSLLDIPYPAWRKIEQWTIAGKNCGILNLCQASPKLDQIIVRNSSSSRVRLTGEKVFRVLLWLDYLDKDDITSCLNSGSQHLQRFAGSNWYNCWLASMQEHTTVVLKTSADIMKLLEEIKMSGDSGWRYFTFKRFLFDCSRVDSVLSPVEYEKFWDAAITFLRQYAEYVVSLSVIDTFADGRIQDIISGLVQRFPRIETFLANVYLENKPKYYYNISASRTFPQPRMNVYRTSPEQYYTSFCCFDVQAEDEHKFLTKTGIKPDSWLISKSTLKTFAATSFENGTLLKLSTAGIAIGDAYKELLEMDVSIIQNIETLTVSPKSNLESLAVAKIFPRLKTLYLLYDSRNWATEIGAPAPGVVFHNVKKLIMDCSGNYPFPGNPFRIPMGLLPMMFPSLMYLKLKARQNKVSLINQFRTWVNEHVDINEDNGDTDILRLYVEGRSLDDSEIWSLMKNLLSITVETVHKYTKLLSMGDGGAGRDYASFIEEVFYRPHELK